MTPYYADDWLTVHAGDCRQVLPTLPDASADCVVTSPPYWQQRSYIADEAPEKAAEIGREENFDGWLTAMRDVARELARVLRPDGSMWLVLGDKYCANPGQHGTGRTTEWAATSRPPRRKSGAAAGFPPGVRRKSLLLAPYRLALALMDDGWILRDRVVWEKPNALPESVGDRLSVRDEVIFRFTLTERAYFDLDAVREPYRDSSLQRVQHRAMTFSGMHNAPPGQPPRTPRPPIMGGSKGPADGVTRLSGREWELRSGKNPGNVWRVATAARPGASFDHFAMFPAELVRRPILATCPRGGVVLDPFAGSGTVGEVANALLRRAVLVELDPASLDTISTRCHRRPIVEVPA